MLELGSLLVEQGKAEEGLQYFTEALELANELGKKKIVAEAHKEIAEVFKKKDNAAKALEHLTLHYIFESEIFSSDTKKSKSEAFNIREAIAEKSMRGRLKK